MKDSPARELDDARTVARFIRTGRMPDESNLVSPMSEVATSLGIAPGAMCVRVPWCSVRLEANPDEHTLTVLTGSFGHPVARMVIDADDTRGLYDLMVSTEAPNPSKEH